MKVLILTITAGNAHNACAEAVRRRIGTRAETEIVDLFQSFSPRYNEWISNQGYDIAVGRLLPIYNQFYEHFLRAAPRNRYSNQTQHVIVSTLAGLAAKLAEFQPDAVLCTHYNCAVAMSDLRLVYPLPCFIASVCLDYTLSPFWESAVGVDRFILPHERLIEACLERGYRPEQLLPCGMPVDERFFLARRPKGDAPFTVLILFGGGSWSGIETLFRMAVRALRGRHARIIVVNGNNRKSFEKIERSKKKYPLEIVNLAFTKELPTYFAEADVIVNKCGGANAAEMLAAGRPMLIWERLPAQELHNLRFLMENGVALSFGNEREFSERLIALLEDENRREEMASRARALARNGVTETADLLVGVPIADWSEVLPRLREEDVEKECKQALREADRAEKQSYGDDMA